MLEEGRRAVGVLKVATLNNNVKKKKKALDVSFFKLLNGSVNCKPQEDKLSSWGTLLMSVIQQNSSVKLETSSCFPLNHKSPASHQRRCVNNVDFIGKRSDGSVI